MGSASTGGTDPGSTLERLRSLCPTVSVGILSADLMDLSADLTLLEQAGVGIVHFDVMDGRFCPQLTVGPAYVKGVRTRLLKDVHLMIHEPLDRLPDYVAAGADIITVQLEAAIHIHRVLQRLGSVEHAAGDGRRLVRGLALNPATPLEWLAPPLLDEVDLIVLLAVDPGWRGQKFILATMERISRVKELVAAAGKDILICVDGGITRENIAAVSAARADLVVTGSAVFDGRAPTENARFMLSAMAGSASPR